MHPIVRCPCIITHTCRINIANLFCVIALSGAFGEQSSLIPSDLDLLSSLTCFINSLGNGAGFALEDSYALAQSVAWVQLRGHSLKDALDFYDRVRSPHYHELVCFLQVINFSRLS
jgi:hypothetical protein